MSSWLILLAVVAGVLLAGAVVIGYAKVKQVQLDVPEPKNWTGLEAHCLKCESEWVKVFTDPTGLVRVGDPVECPACSATGVVTKL
jgi:hypothetical protein